MPDNTCFVHSLLSDFTGFATEARIACKLTVNKAMSTATEPAITNIHQLILILYAYSPNHSCIAYHATGVAISSAMITNIKNSLDNKTKRDATLAPKTFLIP